GWVTKCVDAATTTCPGIGDTVSDAFKRLLPGELSRKSYSPKDLRELAKTLVALPEPPAEVTSQNTKGHSVESDAQK
ncbi:MAG: hypothetical protein ACREBW_07375, partial [Candidatus Micrarchaeaceae archaeon]